MPEKEDLEKEVEKLKAVNATYEAEMGKIRSLVPLGRLNDHSEFYTGQHHLVAFISDTHLGSKLCRYNHLDTAFKLIQQEGIKKVYHSGDMVDGVGVYRGQHSELRKHTFEEQKDDVIKNFPKVDGINVYYISGNHDASFVKTAGADICLAISKERKDLVYLGPVEADIKLARQIRLRLRHPGKGSAYAISYPIQRYISNLASDGHKPNILAEGHRHSSLYLDYRNIHALQVPTFQAQSLFMKEMGLMPTVGFWICSLHIKDGSINRFCPELIKFF